MIKETIYYGRMALGVAQGLRMPSAPRPKELVREQFENRAERFLNATREVIFERPQNPYHKMFQLAGCAFGDLVSEVRKKGLETVLAQLQTQGVWLAHDEFKGRHPIVRSGQEIPARTTDFRGPASKGLLQVSSSGSRSAGTISERNVELLRYREASRFLADEEFGLADRARVTVAPILPSFSGIGGQIGSHRRDQPIDRWFAVGGKDRSAWHYRLATRMLVHEARLLGARLSMPEYMPPNDFLPPARRIAELRDQGIACVVHGMASSAVRVAAAAREHEIDISGTYFFPGGEALTDAKRAVIESCGAEAFPNYSTTELGGIGLACRQMTHDNTVHVFEDAVAVINRRRKAPLADIEVDSLLFTTLLSLSPYFLINVEMDDAGTIETRNCDCAFGRFGYHRCIRGVYSYGKLTGQGITLMGSDLLEVLERHLPARFGGAAGDYQLVEHEGEGQTELSLRVNPRVVSDSAEEIQGYLLHEVRRLYGGALAERFWSHTNAIKVVLEPPLMTQSGKVLPLYLLGSSTQREVSGIPSRTVS